MFSAPDSRKNPPSLPGPQKLNFGTLSNAALHQAQVEAERALTKDGERFDRANCKVCSFLLQLLLCRSEAQRIRSSETYRATVKYKASTPSCGRAFSGFSLLACPAPPRRSTAHPASRGSKQPPDLLHFLLKIQASRRPLTAQRRALIVSGFRQGPAHAVPAICSKS